MFCITLYILSVLFNFFVVFPVFVKFTCKDSIREHDVMPIVIGSCMSVLSTFTIFAWMFINFCSKRFSLTTFLNNLWRMK